MATGRKQLEAAYVRVSVRRRARSKAQAVKFRVTAQDHAQDHALEALDALAWLAKNAGSEAARVSAANAVLDRALGKPASGARVAGGDDNPAEGGLEVQWLDPGKS